MPHADTIIIASAIHTLADGQAGTALALADGHILAIGEPEELASLHGPATEVIDFPGATITPGLCDGHTHVVLGLDLTRGLNLTDVGPLEEVQRRLTEAGEKAGDGEWILGWGLDPNVFTSTGFRGTLFDHATAGRPVLLRMRDGHSAVANSAALRAASITGRETFPDEARIDLDADGRPTGYLVEFAAIERVTSAIPDETFPARAARLLTVLCGMARTGTTSTHVMDFTEGTAELMHHLETIGDLPLRLRFSPMVLPGMTHEEIQQIIRAQGTGGRRWEARGVKFFIDGTVDNGSAWLEEPDSHGQGTRSVWTDTDQYRQTLAQFVRRGIPTATHAIGDHGVRFTLDALEAAGVRTATATHRIEHIETIPDELVPRFADLGVAASMQPIHGTHHTCADGSDNWSQRLGPTRASRGWRCRDLREAGATLALGSDWPITHYDPRAVMADAVLRRPAERPSVTPIQPEQALTTRMALEGYTSHAAAADGLANREGSLAPGMRADLTIFAGDPLDCPAEDLATLPVVGTFVDGVKVDASPSTAPATTAHARI
ncbi:amidohydrolase [Nesterenkonia sp. CL21]|uniref:amidohydrolase n=1 Tax=Nesterenkonia sp. CL21 TaxID=3064894 RepID=UPI00287992A0|nr:amidohydrolase [Nesterenkonia sp. CL21]MDS2172703.1 amidohydrolase [Nesterenkonia sp. CL21]